MHKKNRQPTLKEYLAARNADKEMKSKKTKSYKFIYYDTAEERKFFQKVDEIKKKIRSTIADDTIYG